VSYTIGKLKEVYPSTKFLKIDTLDLFKYTELIEQAHSKSHVDFLLEPKFHYWVCRKCRKQMSMYQKLTFDQFIQVQQICVKCNNKLNLTNIYGHIDTDTYFTPETTQVILQGVGILDQMVQQIVSKTIVYGFALIRPPGHHCCNKGAGFCLCNNAVVATRTAQKLGLSKVLILDIDFHHGDGTQALITDKSLTRDQIDQTHMISIHGFGPGIYPGTGSESESEPNVLNIPIHITRDKESREYANDSFYQGIIDDKVHPYISNFNPDLIVVSLGIDGHRDDILEGLNIGDSTYVHIAEVIKSTGKPTIFVLEGGYNIHVIHSVISKMIKVFE
jgi:acetoin utilization deacetylase AcuC-like enzyme